MFGYIIINQSEMKFKEFDIYHSYYCGLCRKLKEKYGIAGQISLSYDMTFIVMLLTGLYEPETETDTCKCAAHPFERHTTRINIFTDYIADMNVVFTAYKCMDDWEDERKLHRFLYGRLLEKKGRKYKKLYGELYREKLHKISLLMQELKEAEQAGITDIDTMSGTFGKVMAQITMCRQDEWSENLYQLGFYLGKFIYLLDAYEDVETDIKKGTYNPFKQKYEEPGFEEECRTILTMMMSECCKEFEKLPILENVEILRNILYSGVWCRYEMVREKRMAAQRKGKDSSWTVSETGNNNVIIGNDADAGDETADRTGYAEEKAEDDRMEVSE